MKSNMNMNMNINIKTTLHTLTYNQQLTYGYTLCKKLFPDYALFSEYEEFGKPDVLYSGLVTLRKFISGIDNKTEISELVSKLWDDEEITPDTEDFAGNVSASLALNAVSALYHCLKFAETPNIEFIDKVSDLSLESVVMYFVVSNGINQNLRKEEYYKLIENSVFVQSEIQLQNSLIDKIKNIGILNKRFYTKIKTKESRLVENSLYSQFVYA